MRKPKVALMAENISQIRKRVETPEQLVCLGLVLAMLALALRIASIW
jgi:uncharacterized membrane protein